MRRSVSTMETFYPAKPAWQKWHICLSLLAKRPVLYWANMYVLERERLIFALQLCPDSQTCSKPVGAGRCRQAATAPWYEGVSRVVQSYAAAHSGWFRCRKAQLVATVLMKAHHHTSANTTYSISVTEFTGIKRVWPLLSQFLSQLFSAVCIFGQNLNANSFICQHKSTKTMHSTSSHVVL